MLKFGKHMLTGGKYEQKRKRDRDCFINDRYIL